MGFTYLEVLPKEWEVVEAVAQLIKKNPHWLANFGANTVVDKRIISWDLRMVGLTSLPENFGNLTMLDTLDLGGNEIRELPSSFGKLVNLTYLTINSNVIFPPACKGLTNLRQLDTRDKGSTGGSYIASKMGIKRSILDKMEEGFYVHRLNRGIEYLRPKEVNHKRKDKMKNNSRRW